LSAGRLRFSDSICALLRLPAGPQARIIAVRYARFINKKIMFKALLYFSRCTIAARTTMALAALLMAQTAAAAPTDSIEQRVKACSACHSLQNKRGPDAYYPRIAGKPAGYLYNQLVNFRDGRRHYPLMTYLVEHLSDDYLHEIAQYFSDLKAPYPPPQPSSVSSAMLEQGRTLVRHGDKSRDLPACSSCHGESMMGVAPAVPGLLGLPREYIAAQVGAWKGNSRHALAPDCMAKVANKLTQQEVDAVSAWLAAQPPAHEPAPEHIAVNWPMQCGSVPASLQGAQR
jgi:cytochrome c553